MTSDWIVFTQFWLSEQIDIKIRSMKRVPYINKYRRSSFLQTIPAKTERIQEPESEEEEVDSPRHPETCFSNSPTGLSVTISSALEQEVCFPLFSGEETVTHRSSDHHIASDDQFTVPEFSFDSDHMLVTNERNIVSLLNLKMEGDKSDEEPQVKIEEEDRESIQKFISSLKVQESSHKSSQIYITLSACKDSMSRAMLLKNIKNKFNPKSACDLFRKNPFNEIECPQCPQCKTPLTQTDLLELFPQYNAKDIANLIQLYSLKELQLYCPCRKVLEKVLRFDIKRADPMALFEWDNKDKIARKLMRGMLALQKSIASHLMSKKVETKLKQDLKRIEKYYKEIVKLAGCYSKEESCPLAALKEGGIELLRLRHLLDARISPITKR